MKNPDFFLMRTNAEFLGKLDDLRSIHKITRTAMVRQLVKEAWDSNRVLQWQRDRVATFARRRREPEKLEEITPKEEPVLKEKPAKKKLIRPKKPTLDEQNAEELAAEPSLRKPPHLCDESPLKNLEPKIQIERSISRIADKYFKAE